MRQPTGEAFPQTDPLHYNYKTNRPVKTLLFLLDRRGWYYLLLYTVFLIKHSPAWMMPFLLARIINTLNEPEKYTPKSLAIFALIYAFMLVMNIPFQTYMSILMSGAIRRMESRLRSALMTRLHQLSFSFLDTAKSGKLQAKILRDVEQVQFMCWHMGQVGPMMVSSIMFAIGYTAITEPLMLLFFAVLAPISIMMIRFFRENMKLRNEKFREQIETMNSDVSEAITMIPVTRAHGVEEIAQRPLYQQFGIVEKEGIRLDKFNAVFGSSTWVVFQGSLAAALMVSFWLAWKGYIKVGDVVIYQSLFSMIVGSVEGITNTFPIFTRGIESLRSIGEVIECPDLEHNEGRRAVSEVRGDVRFDKVEFSYDGKSEPAVTDFSLDVKAGETIALVGASGSGKSTLMSLLIGFRRPTKGHIYLDGIPNEELDMRSWRQFISVVPQQPLLISGSIRENIAYGHEHLREEKIQEAIDMANLRDFVDSLPKGIDTPVGEGGGMLSGGQRQRIAIARAFVRNPRVIILDEATSALDVVSERLVQQAVERLAKGRTTFIIAHRLSTIRNAGRIVVMKEGRIVEMGTPDELLARQGEYYSMVALQS